MLSVLSSALLPTASIPGERRHFLGVERSATGRAWRDRLDERGAARALAIAQRHDLPELLARVLAGRGVETRRRRGLSRSDRARADARSERALRHGRGGGAASPMRSQPARRSRSSATTTSTARPSAATLARFLRLGGIEPIIHIPDRMFEGYGPNVEAIRALAGRGATLLVTVDCGTTSHEPLAEARAARHRRRSSSTIIIADETLPPALAVVNPNRLDDLSKLGHLAAVGLVFMTVVAVEPRAAPARFLDARRGRSPICSTCSTSSRSAPSPTWCRSRGSTAPSSPRGCWRCAGARMPGSPR